MAHSILEELKKRGHIQDISDEAGLTETLYNKKISYYCGFDPTSDSLHVGHLLPIIVMRKLSALGHTSIALLGTGTGMIGDPSGKSAERNLLETATVLENAKKLEVQISSLFENKNIKIVKNGDWLTQYSYIDVLRDVGKNFSVNQMIARDSVKSRLTEREQGISYTEFSYMILQAMDFMHLYKNENCLLQIGGSDQWGNIMSGIDLIRRAVPHGKSFGLTIPLLLNSNGKKFGKTESGNVWLSEEKTSVYSFYQFWLNIADEDVIRYLELFTDLPLDTISEIATLHSQEPHKRNAQLILAEQVSTLVHGKEKTERAIRASRILFGNKSNPLLSEDMLMLRNEIPTIELPSNEYEGMPLIDIIVRLGASESKTNARKLIQGGGVSINEQKITDQGYTLSTESFIDNTVLLLKTGKKNYFLVIRL